ncbi:hypothetical protein CBS101457_006836 [Exobasidium rhododendri]|nr:hypothetical protein CBS101457_006836 [Exobasidium rhododendri]
MTSEAREMLMGSGDDGDSQEKPQQQQQIKTSLTDAYLTPLQRSLLYELTTRRAHIAAANSKADFWQNRQKDSHEGRRRPDALDEDFYDREIRVKKAELLSLCESERLKEAVVQSADAAHTINASMAATLPNKSIREGSSTMPPSRLPLRYMAARRDELSLEFLRIDMELKQVRSQRRDVAENIEAGRDKTSSLIRRISEHQDHSVKSNGKTDIRFQELVKELSRLKKARLIREHIFAERDALEKAKEGNGDGSKKVKLSSREMRTFLERVRRTANAPQEIQDFIEASLALSDKSMMEVVEELGKVMRGRILQEFVRGTLRSLILESGLDWYGNKTLRELMFTLSYDEQDGSEDEPDFDSDDENDSR